MVGKKFDSVSALYEQVTGKPYPKSGAKNIKAAKAELDRYVVYQKACEIDPIEKRKKPVIVTEVYDPPLPAETDRGRSGEYIKLLRPLLLSQVAFEGKLCALCNLMESFDAYMEVLKENPIVKIKLAVIKNESDLDIWKPELYPKIGERYYVSILKGNLRRRIKYALDSLQGQGIVRWKEITRIVPDICTETDEGTEERPETQSETDERIAECIEQIREQAAMKNSCLDAELVISLLLSVYAKEKRWNYRNEQIRHGSIQPFTANERQEQALENFNDFVRQKAFTEYQHRKDLAPMAEVPIGGDFFGNPYLAKQFAQLQKRYTERLLAGIKAWKEISYQVIDPEKALKYCPEEYDRIEDAAALSKRFVEFMDGQMEKVYDISSKDLRGDFKTFGDGRDTKEKLADSESAMKLHEKLKELYGLC